MSALLDDDFVGAFPELVPERPALRLVPCTGPDEPDVRSVPVRSLPTERPVRLTRRGVVVLSLAVGLLAAALVALAWLSAPSGAGSAPPPAVAGDTVAVAPGDSLWSIAERVAPGRDPRAEVALLQRLNHLDGSALVPGQVLRIR